MVRLAPGVSDGRLGQFKLAVGAGCGAQREGRVDSLQGNGCSGDRPMLGIVDHPMNVGEDIPQRGNGRGRKQRCGE